MCRLLLALVLGAAAVAATDRPRLVVLTDIGGDPDDTQSMIRLMTFSNEFDIEGLVASASGTPGELQRAVVQPQLIGEIVEAYGRVRPNLARHASGFPAAEALLKAIKPGSPHRGIAHLGAAGDTEGSRWIVAVVDRPDPRPVNVAIWGGSHDLAQALWRVRNDRGAAAAAGFAARLRVHSIGHQDETGPWIVENFPDLFFILSSADQGDVLGKAKGRIDRRLSVYRGMYLGGDESLTSREWIEANVRSGHGPLGALYPPRTWTAPNPHGALKEGDTPSWFYFLANGLSDPEHPEWGGWGGRFRRVRDRYYNDAPEGRASVWRWRPAFQNAFAARMDWCVGAGNHSPVAVLNGDRSRGPVWVRARAGSQVRLSAHGSAAPGGQPLDYRWFHYPEPGGQAAPLDLRPSGGETLAFAAPASPMEIHIILEVSERRKPALVGYRRAIVQVVHE